MADEGGEFYAAQDFLYSKGLSQEDGKSWMNRVIAEAIFNSIEVFSSSGAAGQFVDVKCDPDPIPGRAFADNQSCIQCQAIRDLAFTTREAIEAEAVKLSKGKYTRQHLTGEVKARWESTDAFVDPCRYVCYNCILENNDQVAYLQLDSSASWTDEFKNAFERQLRNTVTVEVIEKQKDLEKAKKHFDPGEVSTHIIMMMTERFWETQVIQVFNLVVTFQEIRIANNSNSVVASRNVQKFSGRAILQFVASITADVAFYDQAEVDQTVQDYEKFDTFGDLQDDLKHVVSSLGDLWKNVWGKIIVIMISVLMIVIVGTVGIMFFTKQKKDSIEKK